MEIWTITAPIIAFFVGMLIGASVQEASDRELKAKKQLETQSKEAELQWRGEMLQKLSELRPDECRELIATSAETKSGRG